MPEIPLSRTPATYQEVLKGAGSGSVVGPFAIPGSVENVPKLVVVQVTESKPEGEYALEDVRDLLRSRLVEIASIRRLLDALRKETYVSIRLDRSAVAGLGATQ